MNNFTPRASIVLSLARKEADRFNHNYVGTEHILLGLIKLDQGVGIDILRKKVLDLNMIKVKIEKETGHGPDTMMVGHIPYLPKTISTLRIAGEEAKLLNHSYVGTEHILSGLLQVKTIASETLKYFGVTVDYVHNEILRFYYPLGEADVHKTMEQVTHLDPQLLEVFRLAIRIHTKDKPITLLQLMAIMHNIR